MEIGKILSRGLIFCMGPLFLFLFLPFAQKGTYSGKISDAKTGEVSPRECLFNRISGMGISSDLEGLYLLSLDTGNHVISYSMLGYETVKRNIHIGRGRANSGRRSGHGGRPERVASGGRYCRKI
jgi:hypothetical protein